jgi:hypothetical protein
VEDKSNLDLNKSYYTIDNDARATVYQWKYNSGKWEKRDGAYEDTGTIKETKPTDYLKNLDLYEATTNKTRFDYFKPAAKSLIDELPENSKLSIVTFYKEAKIEKIGGKDVITVTPDTKNSIKKSTVDLSFPISERALSLTPMMLPVMTLKRSPRLTISCPALPGTTSLKSSTMTDPRTTIASRKIPKMLTLPGSASLKKKCRTKGRTVRESNAKSMISATLTTRTVLKNILMRNNLSSLRSSI